MVSIIVANPIPVKIAPMSSRTLRVGIVQNRAVPDLAQNLRGLEAQVRDATARGATLVALPEACEFLSPDNAAFDRHARLLEEHPAALALRKVARDVSAWILVGSLSVRADDGRLANRSVLVSPRGEVHATYDKINLFDAAAGDKESLESRLYQRGATAVVVDIGVARLGLSICYDLRFPQLYRALAQHGANVLAIPSAFMKITGEAHWHALLRARAIETGCYVLAPAQCGSPHDGRENFGHSLVVSPWGEILAEAGDDPAVLVVDLDLAQVDEARRRIPSLSQNFDFSVTTV
jgi:predicted amidohydrolase